MRVIPNTSFRSRHHPAAVSTVLRSPRHCIPLFPRSFSLTPIVRAQLTSASSAELDIARTGRSASIASPPSNLNTALKIDVNPPKGTRDFPPGRNAAPQLAFSKLQRESSEEANQLSRLRKKHVLFALAALKEGGSGHHLGGCSLSQKAQEEPSEAD